MHAKFVNYIHKSYRFPLKWKKQNIQKIASMFFCSTHIVLKLSGLCIAKPISGKEQKILTNN